MTENRSALCAPVRPSDQLVAWLGPVRNGFKPNGKIAELEAEDLADFFQVSRWELDNVLAPLIAKERQPWQDEEFYANAGGAWSEISKLVLKLKRGPIQIAGNSRPSISKADIHEATRAVTRAVE